MIQVAAGAESLDYTLFRSINGLVHSSHVLDLVMVAVAKYSPEVYALALAALWLTWKRKNQRGALLAGVSALLALGFGQVIGHAFPRLRPYLAHAVTTLITHSPDTSLPSDHTTLAFAVAVGLWPVNRRASAALLIFGSLVAFARVFVGAHYPGDVLGGAMLGAVTSVGVWALAETRGARSWIDGLFRLLVRLRIAALPEPSAAD